MPTAVVEKFSNPHLMEYLPAIYQEADPLNPRMFLGQYLLAFEEVLLGVDKKVRAARPNDRNAPAQIEGLREKISRICLTFDPGETPEEFLPWLAGWAALTMRFELSSARKRKLLASIIPLYRIRGTRKYLEELLKLCVDAIVTVDDGELPPLQVGVHSTVGSDTVIGGGPPYYFSVTLVAPKLSQQEQEKQIAIAHSVIELAKPAYTFYQLSIVTPRMQFGVHAKVGLDTVLGPTSE